MIGKAVEGPSDAERRQTAERSVRQREDHASNGAELQTELIARPEERCELEKVRPDVAPALLAVLRIAPWLAGRFERWEAGQDRFRRRLGDGRCDASRAKEDAEKGRKEEKSDRGEDHGEGPERGGR